MAMNAKKLLTTAALALVMTGSIVRAEDKPAGTVEPTLPAIMVVAVKDMKLVDRVIVTGTVRAVEEVYVAPQVEGLQIKALNVDVGDVVKEGDILAVLNGDSLVLQKSQLEANKARVVAAGAQVEAQLMEAKANSDEAVRQANRAETLAKNGSGPTSQAEQARASATVALARVNSAEQAIEGNKADMQVIETQIDDINLRLQRTGVKATVSGVVSMRNAKIGSIASGAGQPLFSIIRDGAVEVQADVAESDILKIQPGQKAGLSVAGGKEKLDGTVRLVDPTIDAQTRLGTVHITIAEPSRVRIGMYAKAEVIVSERTEPALPLTAVTSDKNTMMARKIEDNRIKLVPVVTGVVDGEYIEIVSGLAAGDDVVLKAGAYVRDGDRINPVRQDQAAVN